MKRRILGALAALATAALTVQAQNISVHGTVLSAHDNEPLIGATVMSESTHKGVATDLDGKFEISVPEGTSLTVTYVGYRPQTVKAASSLRVLLEEDSQVLDDLVVVGYQVIKKADLTGAVSVMNMNDPLSENSGNIISSMAGKLPGVNVVSDAAPGGTGSIVIRGMGSAYSPTGPLYIVDGVPVENIDMVNPADIESMQVLKDAASASIYGSRAANGVIIITTKHGKGDRISINVNYALSAQTIAKKYEVLNAEQWGNAYWTAARNSNMIPGADPNVAAMYGNGATPQLQQYIGGNPNYLGSDTNWQDEIYRNAAWVNNLTASVANNSEKGSVLFSLNMIDQQGTLKTTNYTRFSGRVNSRFDYNKYITIGENLLVSRWKTQGADVAGTRGIPMLAVQCLPALPVYGQNGNYTIPFQVISNDKQNPVQMLDNASDNENISWKILGNAFLEVKPIDGLSIKTNIGIEHSQFMNTVRGRAEIKGGDNYVQTDHVEGTTWTWTNTANYVKSFNEKHNINVLLGTEAIRYNVRNVFAKRQGLMFEDADYMQIDAANGNMEVAGTRNSWAIFSLFAKADYNYADRYLVSATVRRDENSRFAKKHRAGVFPAASVAWRLSKEAFWPENAVVNDLKVRYSWGQNGNANIDQLYPTYSSYKYDNGNGAYDIAGSNASTTPGIILAASGNPDLTWETTTQNNIGLDLQLLNGSINLSADYYIKKTTDMLTIPPALAVAGQNAAMWLNTGTMKNTGWEVAVNYISPSYGDFSWNATLNMSQYKNKLEYLNSRQEFIPGDYNGRLIPGQPVGVYYGYVCDGIFNSRQEVADHASQLGAAEGRLRYRDLNGDGVINEDDRCIIGDPNPDFTMGLNLGLKYKRVSLDMFFTGDFGFDIYNASKEQLHFMYTGTTLTNRGKDLLDAWTPERHTDIPALTLDMTNNEVRASSYYIENGSYLKMKYIKLAYSFPQRIAKAITAQSIDVYGQVENVFTATKYKGLDPEILPGKYGVRAEDGAWMRPRTFTLGINLAF